MRASNYSEYEIEQRRNRIRQFQNDPKRKFYFDEMFKLQNIGTYPFAIVNKEMTKVLENGYKWHSPALEIAYNRIVIRLYEYEHSNYGDLFLNQK